MDRSLPNEVGCFYRFKCNQVIFKGNVPPFLLAFQSSFQIFRLVLSEYWTNYDNLGQSNVDCYLA